MTQNEREVLARIVMLDDDPIIRILQDCIENMLTIEDTSCDHDVGICWCGWHRCLDSAVDIITARRNGLQRKSEPAAMKFDPDDWAGIWHRTEERLPWTCLHCGICNRTADNIYFCASCGTPR